MNACTGSGAFPTNYDGETTVCDVCGRRLRLHVGGWVPHHKPKAKTSSPSMLPRGEAVIDGRRTT